MQAVRNGSGISQVMVIVQHRIGKGLRHMADLLRLGHQVKHSVLDVLDDIRHTVRAVQVHVTLLLAYEGFVPLRVELLPQGNEVLHHRDVGAGFNVKVSGVEEATHVEARNELQRLVLGVRGGTLPVKVEVVRAGRSLQITLLERLSVPDAVCLVHHHVVHVDRNPHVAGGHRNFVVYAGIYNEIVGLPIPVADEIHAGLLHGREVEAGVIILIERSPHLHLAGKDFLHAAILLNLAKGGR